MVRAALGALTDVTFVEAGSGLQAIETLAIQPVQMVVLDLNMPDMHGLDVLRFLRSHTQYRALPVMVLTTRGDDAEPRRRAGGRRLRVPDQAVLAERPGLVGPRRCSTRRQIPGLAA